MSLQASNERTPPDAFTFTVPLYLTVLYIRRTSSLVAPPPVANPVDVLTKAAPASAARTHAATFSSGDGINPVSMMTFTGTCPTADIIVRRCSKIWEYRGGLETRRPSGKTVSISSAPSLIACWASLYSRVCGLFLSYPIVCRDDLTD